MDFRNRQEFSSLSAWILEVFPWCFSLRFSGVRCRKSAFVAKCDMPGYYGFCNRFSRFPRFTFFSPRPKKQRFRPEFRCKKRSKFRPELPRKSDAKNHGISSKIHGNWPPGWFFWPFRCLWPLFLATKRVAEARCHVATATKRPVARGKRPVARGKWPVARGPWRVVSSHPKSPRGRVFWI